jgi:O-antigen/teichoic acid export membrane protein
VKNESISSLRLEALPSPVSGLFRCGIWGFTDQALISATNFITMVLLARSLSPTEFGYFTLVYLGIMFAGSMQSSLVTIPHNVLGANLHGENYAQYTTSTAAGQLLFALGSGLLVLAGAGIARFAGSDLSGLLLGLVPAMVAWLLQEFVRRVLYTERRLGAAFTNDIISYGGQMFVIAVLWHLGLLTASVALYVLATTSLLATALGIWQIRHSLTREIQPTFILENWRYGKWIAGAEFVGTWVSLQLYVYIAAVIVGPAAAATLNAASILFGPLRILMLSLNTILPIQFARTVDADGTWAFGPQLKLAYAVSAPLAGIYCLLVAVLADALLRLVYVDKYIDSVMVVVLYAIFYFLASLMLIMNSALSARRLTRPMFISRLYGCLISLPIGWLMTAIVGVEGAVLGMILATLCVNLLLWRAHRLEAVGATGPLLERRAGPFL